MSALISITRPASGTTASLLRLRLVSSMLPLKLRFIGGNCHGRYMGGWGREANRRIRDGLGIVGESLRIHLSDHQQRIDLAGKGGGGEATKF